MLCTTLSLRDGAYKSFGPYWWQLKSLLKQAKIGKNAWYRGSYTDQMVFKNSNHGSPLLNLWAALRYKELHGHNSLGVPEIHICEWWDGQVGMYEAIDHDMGHQLDLFESARQKERFETLFLQETQEFLPRPWRERGEKALHEGNPWRAIVCFKRAIAIDGGAQDKNDAWLFLAQAFEAIGHFAKASFCYEILFKRSEEHWTLGYMAACQLELNHYQQALELFEQALTYSPGNPEFLSGRDRALHACASGNTSEAHGIEFHYQERAS